MVIKMYKMVYLIVKLFFKTSILNRLQFYFERSNCNFNKFYMNIKFIAL